MAAAETDALLGTFASGDELETAEALRHLAIILVLLERGQLSQQLVADYLRINRSVMVKLIDALEVHGDVVRARNAADRRSYALQVTPEGRRHGKALVTRMRAAERELASHLSKTDAGRLVHLLARLLARDYDPALPSGLRSSLVWLVSTASERIESLGDERLRPLGLSVRAYISLAIVGGLRCSQAELAANLAIGPAATVDLVDALEEAGAVRRARNAADRRSYVLEVSAGGRALERQARLLLRRATAEFTACLGPSENEELLALLARLTGS
jgi:DNA-binding MarR family transcriptional regulator